MKDRKRKMNEEAGKNRKSSKQKEASNIKDNSSLNKTKIEYLINVYNRIFTFFDWRGL
jgi:hypothetical protein